MTLQARRLQVDASPAAMQDYFEQQGWSDGLPVVPPTPELVMAMVEGSGLEAGAEVAAIAPSLVNASVEKIAINAVMAGCRPEYMPVIVAALRALAQPAFNLAGVQATTHPVAPLVFLNGPIRHQISLNCSSNVFGQGFRANATIGRAIRLVLMNIGQAIPGKADMATHGTPCKFSFCGGENEEESPWEPLHVEHGMAPGENMVTVHAAESAHNVQDHASATAGELLLMISDVMMSVGSNNMSSGGEIMVALGPEHARILSRHGMSKEDVRADLYRRMRLRLDRVSAGSRAWYRTKRRAFDVASDVTEISYLDSPSQILIVVAGGPGLHTLVIPSFGISHSARERIPGARRIQAEPAPEKLA